MEKPVACLMCDTPLDQPATGRPRTYCGVACRRAAEYELRRIQSLLRLAEKRDVLAREAVAAAMFADERGPLRKVAKFWAGELERLCSLDFHFKEVQNRFATLGL